jgi:hypothetical protein
VVSIPFRRSPTRHFYGDLHMLHLQTVTKNSLAKY